MAATVVRSFVYRSEVDRILRAPGGNVGKVVRRQAMDIAANAKRIATNELGHRHPSDAPRTGKAAGSFQVVVNTAVPQGFAFDVVWAVPYAATLEKGSKPHEIRARKAKTLVFRSRRTGRIVRIKAVNHPGQTVGYKILERAMVTAVKR